MKRFYAILSIVALVAMVMGCKDKKTSDNAIDIDKSNALAADTLRVDSTVYGVCGVNTAMHELELITDKGDTLMCEYNLDEKMAEEVQGGIEAGNRLAVILSRNVEGTYATKVINLTSLCTKWTSLERNIEFMPDGSVISTVKEPHAYTHWHIFNGHLVISADTFDIMRLGPDSLTLKNNNGLWTFKRQ